MSKHVEKSEVSMKAATHPGSSPTPHSPAEEETLEDSAQMFLQAEPGEAGQAASETDCSLEVGGCGRGPAVSLVARGKELSRMPLLSGIWG